MARAGDPEAVTHTDLHSNSYYLLVVGPITWGVGKCIDH